MALLKGEPGGQGSKQPPEGGNYSDVVKKLVDAGIKPEEVEAHIKDLIANVLAKKNKAAVKENAERAKTREERYDIILKTEAAALDVNDKDGIAKWIEKELQADSTPEYHTSSGGVGSLSERIAYIIVYLWERLNDGVILSGKEPAKKMFEVERKYVEPTEVNDHGLETVHFRIFGVESAVSCTLGKGEDGNDGTYYVGEINARAILEGILKIEKL